MYPRIVIDLGKLRHNALTLCAMGAKNSMDQIAFVTKVFCADEKMVQALQQTPCRYLADSRIENLARYPKSDKLRILLRLPMLSQAEDVVRYSDISFNSEMETLRALSAAAEKLGVQHKVVLMIDVGDLREGIFFENTEKLMETALMIHNDPNLELYGAAFNVTCYGSVLPGEKNITNFLSIVAQIEEATGKELPFVSGGNSSSVPLLLQKENPFRRINNLRLGESLILGRETAYEQDLTELYQDVVTLETEVIEVQDKPSYPIGEIGVNAFGERPEYVDIGIHRRAIVAIGRQDMNCDGLAPLTPGVSVIGASSDHLILDVTKANVQMGDVIRFKMDYSGILRGFTSGYVSRHYIDD